VAGRLVDAAAAFAREAGAARLELATQHGNRPALQLYLKKGFVADTEFTHLSLAIDGG
jgi:GNAT superfamily N-acetyltransferase